MEDYVLVIGGALMDVKGKPVAGLEPGTSNPGSIRFSRGGAARNVAENLGRMGADVVLISVVGDDDTGRKLLDPTIDAGVNVEHVITVRDTNSGSYMAILEEDGSLAVALDDVRLMERITPRYLHRRRRLFRDAQLVMFDGSLVPETMNTVIRLALQYDKPLCADPSSTRMAHRLQPHLSNLHLVVPNEREAAVLCGIDYPSYDPDVSLEMARMMVRAGVDIAVVTLSNFGLMYAASDESGYIPPRYGEMVDSTGTGDALTSAILFGMINGLPVTECMRLGAAAAGLTVQTADTVVPDLSLDMLYDHLIV